jgi:uncharacterized membrane protein (Fun14 family)
MSGMQTNELIGFAVATLGSVAVAAVGAFIISKRPETNSLYVEDRMGFAVAKVGTGIILAVVGVFAFVEVLDGLLQRLSG